MMGWLGGWVLVERGWQLGHFRRRCGVEAEGFSNIAVFLKFQFAYFDVRRRRSTLPLPVRPFSPLSNFRNFIECALGEFPGKWRLQVGNTFPQANEQKSVKSSHWKRDK